MARAITELETLLRQLIAAHRRLLGNCDRQQDAMRRLDVAAMEQAAAEHEAIRQQVASLESRRRAVATSLARSARIGGTPTLDAILDAYPQFGPTIQPLRRELRQIVEQVSQRATVSNRVASRVLGHVNAAVKIVADAVQKAGVYSRDGAPRITGRVGAIEAVG